MKAYLVVCPESSGNRMISELLESVGCKLIDGRYNVVPLAKEDIVLTMSMPSNSHWYNVFDVTNMLKEKNYDVTVIVGVREWFGTLASQVKRGRVPDIKASISSTQEAYKRIFGTMGYNDFIVVSFDRMIDEPNYKTRVLEHLGLPTMTNYVTHRR